MTGIGTRKTDITGRATGRRFGNKRTSIGEQFAPHPIRMIRSPAWCALSLSARRVLDRIEIELASHGGTDNGKLPCTYDDLQRYGIHRHAIGPAIREAAALGFLEVTEPGRAGNADWRKPNVFRLTYRNTQNAKPTDEWALGNTSLPLLPHPLSILQLRIARQMLQMGNFAEAALALEGRFSGGGGPSRCRSASTRPRLSRSAR